MNIKAYYLKPFFLGMMAVTTALTISGCDNNSKDNLDNPNVLYSKDHKDPIKKLETKNELNSESFQYHQRFYVPIYSDIYVDKDNPKILLAATLSIRNTTLENPLYVTKIDYYNTQGDFIRSYLDKPIKIPPTGTLNYIVDKDDDTGGAGANFIIDVEGINDSVEPVIEAVMVGHYSNKGFSFLTTGRPVKSATDTSGFSSQQDAKPSEPLEK